MYQFPTTEHVVTEIDSGFIPLVMAMTKEDAARLIYTPNVLHNSSLHTVKFLSSCFAGAVAGTLGLENWAGFAFFGMSTLLTAACLYIINCKGRPSKFIPGGVKDLANPGQDNVFSFVLVWTLFYGKSLISTIPNEYVPSEDVTARTSLKMTYLIFLLLCCHI